MNGKKHRVSQDVKEQVLKRIKNDGVSVAQASEEHGISTKTIYAWLAKGVTAQPSWSEIAKLRKENKALIGLVGELTIKLSHAQKNN